MKYLFILLLSYLVYLPVLAQDDLYGDPRPRDTTARAVWKEQYSSGKIITLSGETINCFILEQKNYYEGKIRYKMSLNDMKALKIKSEKLSHLSIDTVCYDRITFGSYSFMMLKLIDGPVKLYDNITLNSTGPVLLPVGVPTSFTFTEKHYYIVKNRVVYKVTRYTFRDDFKKVFAGNEYYLNLIKEIKYGEFIDNIDKLISGYNADLLKGTPYN